MKAYIPTARASSAGSVRRQDPGGTLLAIVDDRMDPAFMDNLAAGLRSRLPGATVQQWPKPAGTSPAPEPLIREVAAKARMAVVGIGS